MDNVKKEEYNDEPVFYCQLCLSLKVLVEGGLNYCDDCGSTDIASCNIKDWEEMYHKRYNKYYITKTEDKNGRDNSKDSLPWREETFLRRFGELL